ncbi:MAG TPA: PepSY domain-containing protein [Vicinamibacterales bacterium]
MNRFFPVLVIGVMCVAGLGVTCPSAAREISRESAIAVARAEVSFEVVSVNAERAVDSGVRVWRVTLQGAPASPDHPQLRPTMIVLVDAVTGQIVSVAKS